MYYRIVDDYWYPYYFGYNEKSLKRLSKWIYNAEKDFFDENNANEKKILNRLYRWLYNVWWYNVEKSEKPFSKKKLEQSFNF